MATGIRQKYTKLLGLLVDGFPDNPVGTFIDDVHDFIFLHFEMKWNKFILLYQWVYWIGLTNELNDVFGYWGYLSYIIDVNWVIGKNK